MVAKSWSVKVFDFITLSPPRGPHPLSPFPLTWRGGTKWEVGPRAPGPVAGPPSPRLRRGGQGVRTKDAERGNEVGDRPPGSRASCWFPLSAYAERGTGGEDKGRGEGER